MTEGLFCRVCGALVPDGRREPGSRSRGATMTPATALHIARDEWPALRWRWAPLGTAWVVTGRGGGVRVSVIRWVGGRMTVHAWRDAAGTGGSLFASTPANLRRALRAARYALADV